MFILNSGKQNGAKLATRRNKVNMSAIQKILTHAHINSVETLFSKIYENR